MKIDLAGFRVNSVGRYGIDQMSFEGSIETPSDQQVLPPGQIIELRIELMVTGVKSAFNDDLRALAEYEVKGTGAPTIETIH